MICMAATMSLMSRQQTPEFLSKKSKAKSEVETVPKKALDLRLLRSFAPPLYAGAVYGRV